jgi:hypothetical protein
MKYVGFLWSGALWFVLSQKQGCRPTSNDHALAIPNVPSNAESEIVPANKLEEEFAGFERSLRKYYSKLGLSVSPIGTDEILKFILRTTDDRAPLWSSTLFTCVGIASRDLQESFERCSREHCETRDIFSPYLARFLAYTNALMISEKLGSRIDHVIRMPYTRPLASDDFESRIRPLEEVFLRRVSPSESLRLALRIDSLRRTSVSIRVIFHSFDRELIEVVNGFDALCTSRESVANKETVALCYEGLLDFSQGFAILESEGNFEKARPYLFAAWEKFQELHQVADGIAIERYRFSN